MSGTILLAMITVVLVVDYVLAFSFIARANRAAQDIGAPPQIDSEGEVSNPETLRRTARLLMFTAPLLWLAIALLSFGIIPIDGIIPIKF